MARNPVGYASAFRKRSEIKTFLAPVGGLNARDAKAAMPETDAYDLINFVPRADGVETRKGSDEYATGLGGTVKTLFTYDAGDTLQLLGFANGSIFNCTNPGAVGTAIATGRTEDYCSLTMFSNAGAQFLIGCNGADEPFSYDGSTYTGLVMTGVDAADEDLVYVHNYSSRLFFCANDKLGFYYLASAAIQGAASYFDLAQIFSRGGYLLSIGSISRDGGDGPDDSIAFVSSQGEVAVYSGIDPSSSSSWVKVGVYRIPKPIGRRCLFKYGGDLIIITQQGLVPLSAIMSGKPFDPRKDTLSSKLGTALANHNPYSSAEGWEAIEHSKETMVLFNVPANTAGTTFNQYIMDTITGSWAKFDGWDAYCFAEMGDNLYFGKAGGVVTKANTGSDDDGTEIYCDAKAAFSYYDTPALKHWHDARVMCEFMGLPPLSAGFSVNYAEDTPEYVTTPAGGTAPWNTSPWNTTPWGGSARITTFWLTIDKVGFTGSLWVRAAVSGESLKWLSTEVLYENGGLL